MHNTVSLSPFNCWWCPTAGGAAYYFAKQSINADRQARWEADQKRKQITEALEYSNRSPPSNPRKNVNLNGGPPREDHSGSPSQEATSDPAPTRHAPESEGQRVREKSKYEATEPYRAKKGDRFSWRTSGLFVQTTNDVLTWSSGMSNEIKRICGVATGRQLKPMMWN